jgi:hypothetical protein
MEGCLYWVDSLSYASHTSDYSKFSQPVKYMQEKETWRSAILCYLNEISIDE